jgi:hypothetical protein
VERSINDVPIDASRRASERLTDDFGLRKDRAAPDTLPRSAMRAKALKSVRSSTASLFPDWNVVSIFSCRVIFSGTNR